MTNIVATMTLCHWRNRAYSFWVTAQRPSSSHRRSITQQDSPGVFTPDGFGINRLPAGDLFPIPFHFFINRHSWPQYLEASLRRFSHKRPQRYLVLYLLCPHLLNRNASLVGCGRTRSPLDRLVAATKLDALPHARPLPYRQGCRTSFDVFFCVQQRIFMFLQGFPDHPHRGQATVTYIFQGASKHEDSAGHAGIIREGGVQWMCAVCRICSSLHQQNHSNRSHHDRAVEVSISNTTEY